MLFCMQIMWDLRVWSIWVWGARNIGIYLWLSHWYWTIWSNSYTYNVVIVYLAEVKMLPSAPVVSREKNWLSPPGTVKLDQTPKIIFARNKNNKRKATVLGQCALQDYLKEKQFYYLLESCHTSKQ